VYFSDPPDAMLQASTTPDRRDRSYLALSEIGVVRPPSDKADFSDATVFAVILQRRARGWRGNDKLELL
jgi:hypothetical protein